MKINRKIVFGKSQSSCGSATSRGVVCSLLCLLQKSFVGCPEAGTEENEAVWDMGQTSATHSFAGLTVVSITMHYPFQKVRLALQDAKLQDCLLLACTCLPPL